MTEKSKMGRPTHIERWKQDGVYEKRIKQIVLLASSGKTMEQIAKGLGISLSTLHRLKRSHADVYYALKEGHTLREADLLYDYDMVYNEVLNDPDTLPVEKFKVVSSALDRHRDFVTVSHFEGDDDTEDTNKPTTADIVFVKSERGTGDGST